MQSPAWAGVQDNPGGEPSTQPADPLLRPLSPPQRALIEVIAVATAQTGIWPIYHYVQAQLDDQDLDLTEVLASLPFIIGHGNVT
jgi:hypothetical protein